MDSLTITRLCEQADAAETVEDLRRCLQGVCLALAQLNAEARDPAREFRERVAQSLLRNEARRKR